MNKISTAHTPAFWKRPLAGVALPFLCGAFLSACLSSLWIAFLMITGIVIFACFLFRRKRAALFLLCLFCGILHSGIYRAARPVSPQMLEGRTITAEGIVSDCNFKDNAVRCLLRGAALSTGEENVTVKLTMYGVDDLSDGDRTVSYTHLDVYKRQCDARPQYWMAVRCGHSLSKDAARRLHRDRNGQAFFRRLNNLRLKG